MSSPDRSLPRRIAATFVAPGALAATLRERPLWVDVLLLSTAVAVIAAAFLPAETLLGWSEDAVTRRGRPVEITSSPEEIVRWGRYLAMLSALVMHPLLAFGLAGLLALLFTVVGGGEIEFRHHLALASHALLIPALGTLLTLPVGAEASLEFLVFFLDPGSPVREVLGAINLFTVWMLGVLGIAIGVLDPRRPRGRTAALLVGAYVAVAAVVGLSSP